MTDLNARLAKVREIIHIFPRPHFNVLKRLMEHMDRYVQLMLSERIVIDWQPYSIVDYEERNHMTPDNLATVICPNLLRAPNNNFGLIMKNMGPITVLFKAFLSHVRTLCTCFRGDVLTFPYQMHFIFDEDDADEADDGDEDVEGEDVLEGKEDEGGTDLGEVAEVLNVPEVEEPRFTSSPEPDEKLALGSGLPSPPIQSP